MPQSKLERLESIVDRLEGDEPVSADEFRDIAKELETGTKYEWASGDRRRIARHVC